jgi:hypothetical protein
MLTVYIAGSSADLQRAEDCIWAVRKFAAITEDWASKVRANLDAGITDQDITEAEAIAARDACLAGVDAAHIIWWLASPSVGAGFEVGYACKRGVPVVISGPGAHPIFKHCGAYHATDAQALAHLADVAVRRMAGNR